MKATLKLKPGDEITVFLGEKGKLLVETLDRGRVVKLKIAEAP